MCHLVESAQPCSEANKKSIQNQTLGNIRADSPNKFFLCMNEHRHEVRLCTSDKSRHLAMRNNSALAIINRVALTGN